MQGKTLFFAGSARSDSFNKRLARHAYEMAVEKGAQATFVDLRDYPMPLYDGDLEAESGLPDNAKKLKQLFIEHQGLFIAAPEYNSSLAPLLKNTLDWVSRPEPEDAQPLVAYAGKVAALSAASPGGFGGMRGLVPLRMMLGNIKVTVLPDQLAVPSAHEAFNEAGELADENARNTLAGVVESLLKEVDLRAESA